LGIWDCAILNDPPQALEYYFWGGIQTGVIMRSDEPEDIEKIRQAIMRYRELLDVASARLKQHEQIYERLFTQLTPEQRALSEKLQQREAAIIALENLDPLRQALLGASFDLRDIHRAFEETYNNIAPEDTDE
jgi:hypothetical protein